MRTDPVVVVVALLVGLGGTAWAKKVAPKRDIHDRSVTITDATLGTIQELHVAEGNPTSLVFDQPIKEGQEGTLLLNSALFFPVRQTESSVVVVPKRDLLPNQALALTVTLADGTPLTFKLVTTPADVDWEVRITVALDKRAATESPKVLKELNADLQNRLDDCQSQAGAAGLRKIGQLLVGEDLDRPQAFTVERRDVHWRDKQSRLFVSARQVYRLLGTSYLVLTVRNRDTHGWVLDKANVRLPGATDTSDVKVLDTVTEQASLQPDQQETVVVIFSNPPQLSGQKFDVELLEKNGSRHALIEGLAL